MRATIEKGEIKVSRCCRSPFFIDSGGRLHCGGCRKPEPDMFMPWFDESTDMMFELVSDVRKKPE